MSPGPDECLCPVVIHPFLTEKRGYLLYQDVTFQILVGKNYFRSKQKAGWSRISHVSGHACVGPGVLS